jgi:hypothetical protein
MGRSFYRLLTMAAVAAVVYLYVFRFDRFSETQLVQVAYIWLPAMVLGIYGLVAEGAAAAARTESAPRFSDALGKWFDRQPILKSNALLRLVVTLFLTPLMAAAFFARTSSPFVLALIGALIWLVGLKFFFDGIFPVL